MEFDLQLFRRKKGRHARGESKRAGRRVRARAHSGRHSGMEHMFGRKSHRGGRKTVRR